MLATQKLTGRATSIPKGILTALIISMSWTLVASVIGACMVSKEWMAQEKIGIWAIFVLITASVVGGMVAAGRIKRQRIQMASLHGGLYYILLILLNLLCFGGQFRGMGVTLVFVLMGSVVAGILGNRPAGKGNGRRRRKTHR